MTVMPFDFDPIYLIYLLVAASAGLFVEGIYLLFFSGGSYRKNVNRRLKLLQEPARPREHPGAVAPRARPEQQRRLQHWRGIASTGW